MNLSDENLVLNTNYGSFQSNMNDLVLELKKLLTVEEKTLLPSVGDIKRYFDSRRNDIRLIHVVSESHNTRYVVENFPYPKSIDPDRVGWEIREYDGAESLEPQPDRVFRNTFGRLIAQEKSASIILEKLKELDITLNKIDDSGDE